MGTSHNYVRIRQSRSPCRQGCLPTRASGAAGSPTRCAVRPQAATPFFGADPDCGRRGRRQERNGELAQRVDGSRAISTRMRFSLPSDEERERPQQWRFWRALPPKGEIGIFFGAWHTMPILQRVMGEIDEAAFTHEIGRHPAARKDARATKECCCSNTGSICRKTQQKKRLKSLEKDPKTRWRVTDLEWEYFKRYDRFVAVCEPFLRETSTGEAPWIVVPGADAAFPLAHGRLAPACGDARAARRQSRPSGCPTRLRRCPRPAIG